MGLGRVGGVMLICICFACVMSVPREGSVASLKFFFWMNSSLKMDPRTVTVWIGLHLNVMFAWTVLCKCTTHTSVIMCSGTAQLLRSHIGSKWQNTFNYRFVSILFIFIWPPSSQRGRLWALFWLYLRAASPLHGANLPPVGRFMQAF